LPNGSAASESIAFLDRTFRLLTQAVVDHRGQVLDYVGDEIIVIWAEGAGAIESRPLQCFAAMRVALVKVADQFEHDLRCVPRLRDRPHLPVRLVAGLQRHAEILQEVC